jgi:hypothetical protein
MACDFASLLTEEPDMKTQVTLDNLHNAAMDSIQQYASGMVTLPELTARLVQLRREYGDIYGQLDPTTQRPLYDPATGLRPDCAN